MVKASTTLLPCVILVVCFGRNTRVSAEETDNVLTVHVFVVKTGRTSSHSGKVVPLINLHFSESEIFLKKNLGYIPKKEG